MGFRYTIPQTITGVTKLLDHGRQVIHSEASEEEGNCLMKKFQPYSTTRTLPTSTTPQQTQDAINYLTDLSVTNDDYNHQSFTDETLNYMVILLLAGQETVFNSCRHNWISKSGSKVSDARGSSQLDQTMLSLRYARSDAQIEGITDRNIMFNEAGEIIYGVNRWDAFIAFVAIRITIEYALDCVFNGDNHNDDDHYSVEPGDTNNERPTCYLKSGKTQSSIQSRMDDKRTYALECPATKAKLYMPDRFQAMPLLSFDDTVTYLLEWLPLFIFSCFGFCFNSKKESSTSAVSDIASIIKACMFYLSCTHKGIRSSLYRIYRFAGVYHGDKLQYEIRSAFRTLIDQFVDISEQQVDAICTRYQVDVLATLETISSGRRSRSPLWKVLCPNGIVNTTGKKIAAAIVISRLNDETVKKHLDEEHQQIFQERKARERRRVSTSSNDGSTASSASSSSRRSSTSSSSSSSRRTSATSSTSSSSSSSRRTSATSNDYSSTVTSRALVPYDPIQPLLNRLSGILQGSGFSTKSDGRVGDALILLATIDRSDLVYTLLRNLSISNFGDLLNNQLERLNDGADIDDGLRTRIEGIHPFLNDELADGDLFWFLHQFIYGLNREHSPEDCTFYAHLMKYADETRRYRRTENDPNAIFLVPRGHYLTGWYDVIIGIRSQSSPKGRMFNTLPIPGASFDQFALKAIESIGCSPAQMKTAYLKTTTGNKHKRMSNMNGRDNNKRRGRGPPPTK